MKIKDGKIIFTADELKKFIDKISYNAYKEGILAAGRQMKCAVEMEENGIFQSEMDTEDEENWFDEDVG